MRTMSGPSLEESSGAWAISDTLSESSSGDRWILLSGDKGTSFPSEANVIVMCLVLCSKPTLINLYQTLIMCHNETTNAGR